MSNLAVTTPPPLGNITRPRRGQPELHNGQLVAVAGDSFIVSTEAGTLRASRAASCLLDPVENDYVLLSHTRDKNWILAVLERDPEQTATLSFTESVNIKAPQGSINLTAGDAISASSTELGVHAQAASGAFGTLDLVATAYRSCIDSASVVMQTMQVFCRNIQRHFVRSVKQVEGCEDEYAAARTIQGNKVDIVTGSTEIKAGERVAVNASQFHVN